MSHSYLAALLAVSLFGTGALAADASKEEAEKVKAALAAWGCEAGAEIEKETSGVFELDDVKCKEGQYDIKVDKDFKLLSLTRD